MPGKAAGGESLRIYINRLKEGGFVVANLLSKLQQCGLLVGELVRCCHVYPLVVLRLLLGIRIPFN